MLWQPAGMETVTYFDLKDLWGSYREWSAFGTCTKVVLPSGETVKKYFIPYLSAIQIYTNKAVSLRRLLFHFFFYQLSSIIRIYVYWLNVLEFFLYSVKSEVSSSRTMEFESDSWSDDSGSDKLSRSLSNSSSKAWDNISEDLSLDQVVSFHMRERFGHVYLEYFESRSPNWRVPMMDQVYN